MICHANTPIPGCWVLTRTLSSSCAPIVKTGSILFAATIYTGSCIRSLQTSHIQPKIPLRAIMRLRAESFGTCGKPGRGKSDTGARKTWICWNAGVIRPLKIIPSIGRGLRGSCWGDLEDRSLGEQVSKLLLPRQAQCVNC